MFGVETGRLHISRSLPAKPLICAGQVAITSANR